jgi:cell wall-associated NlpC family hydrolase
MARFRAASTFIILFSFFLLACSQSNSSPANRVSPTPPPSTQETITSSQIDEANVASQPASPKNQTQSIEATPFNPTDSNPPLNATGTEEGARELPEIGQPEDDSDSPQVAPDSPSDLAALIEGNRAVLTWNAPQNGGTSSIIRYTATVVSDSSKTCTSLPIYLTCEISGLTYGSTYRFQVVAESHAGASAPAESPQVTVTFTAPSAPRRVTSTRSGNEVVVAWIPPAKTGGGSVNDYRVSATSDPSLSCSRGKTELACRISNLSPHQQYSFVVTATSEYGTSDPSAPSSGIGYPNVTSTGSEAAIEYGLSRISSPYVWAAAGPYAFDTSGFVRWAYLQVGVNLPHYSGAMYSRTIRISESQLQPGDLIFWGPGGSERVAIYLGDGHQLEAFYLHIGGGGSVGFVAVRAYNWWSFNWPSGFGRIPAEFWP